MALRLPRRCLRASSTKQLNVHCPRHSSTSTIAAATAGSNLPPSTQHAIQREAFLPTPDPLSDSATAALVSDQLSFLVATYARPLPMFVKGEGCYLWDLENRRYLDFTAGIAVNSLGHCDPGISRVISQQAKTLIHTSNLYHNPWVGTLSKQLVQVTTSSGAMPSASHAFISNSGTEANEAALKFVRKVGKVVHSFDSSKYEIVSFHNSFHGRTLGALSATPNPKYQAPFAPMLPGFKYGVFNDVDGLEGLINEKTCGVIVEPIQGEGGVNVATPEFLKALRKKCDEVNAVLIFDEIQSGLSRTGYLWAHHRYDPPSSAPLTSRQPFTDSEIPLQMQQSRKKVEEVKERMVVEPDILTTAKALGNGFPIGATLVNDFVAEKIKVGDHGTTFGGNPLACRVAYSVLERLADPALQSQVRETGGLLRGHLQRLAGRFPELVAVAGHEPSLASSHGESSGLAVRGEAMDGTIRGTGLIQGLQLRSSITPQSRQEKDTKKEERNITNKIIKAARERGLLIISCGKDTLRFVPPLILSKDQLEEGIEMLEGAMESVLHSS